VQPQAVLEQRSGAHLDRRGRDHAEAQQRRRDRLQVARVSEEREHVAGWLGQQLLAFEDMDLHPMYSSAFGGFQRFSTSS
jgi:hypothetical protein